MNYNLGSNISIAYQSEKTGLDIHAFVLLPNDQKLGPFALSEIGNDFPGLYRLIFTTTSSSQLGEYIFKVVSPAEKVTKYTKVNLVDIQSSNISATMSQSLCKIDTEFEVQKDDEVYFQINDEEYSEFVQDNIYSDFHEVFEDEVEFLVAEDSILDFEVIDDKNI